MANESNASVLGCRGTGPRKRNTLIVLQTYASILGHCSYPQILERSGRGGREVSRKYNRILECTGM